MNAPENLFDQTACDLWGSFEDNQQRTNAIMDLTERTATTIVCMPQLRGKLTDDDVMTMADQVAACQECQGEPGSVNCQLGDLTVKAAAKIA